MKKFLTTLCFLSPMLLLAQEANNAEGSSFTAGNEIKWDVLGLITETKIQLTYEHQFLPKWSAGLSAATYQSNKDKDHFDTSTDKQLKNYDIIPYIRYHLSPNQNSYYFAEGSLGVNSGKYKHIERLDANNQAIYQLQQGEYTDLALGLAVGYKYILKEHFLGEILVGGGQNILNDDSPKYISRVAISIGYKF